MTTAFQSRPNFNTKETNMPNDNIFSGLKVVDLASFIAGPSAAVILSDFGADVIKVEPPVGDLWRHGHQIPPHQASDGTWFVLIVTPDKLASVAKAIVRPDLLTDPRFSDPTKLMA